MNKTFIPAGARSYGDYSTDVLRMIKGEPYSGKRQQLLPLNYAPVVLKTKTVLCRHWLDSCCRRGKACTFAHGDHEIGQLRLKLMLKSPLMTRSVTCFIPTSVANAMRRKRRRSDK